MKHLWPQLQGDAELLRYFPDYGKKKRLPDREYFWAILNTQRPDFVNRIVNDAHLARYGS